MTQDERRLNSIEISAQLAELRADIADLAEAQEFQAKALETQATAVSGLLDAWTTATGLVRFIKWLAGVAAALATLRAIAASDLDIFLHKIFGN